MQKQRAPIHAAIDIGSNTIHLVVAHCTPDDLDIIEDEVELVRIGESVTATGEISQQKQQKTIDTLCKYKALAAQHEAGQTLVVATEAIRQASNSSKFLEDVERETGLKIHLINGDTEATLTFYGATYEEMQQSNTSTVSGVMDLGGGSTELVTAKNSHINWRTSIQIGSGWLHDRYLPSDPPAPDELSIARAFLQTYIQGMPIKFPPAKLIVTGGSANSLLLLAQQAFRLEQSSRRMTRDDLIRCEGLLTALNAKEISRRYKQPIARARILPAGALIIREMMSRLQLDEIAVSPHGIREGALLAYARYGESWLERINQEAATTGKSNGAYADDGSTKKDVSEETFAQTGQRMLRERVEKLLEWRDAVLKNDDIEAIHKMRVASRRLRATLDAFESCCKPRQFKNAYRSVKEIADLLGTARDTDVMLLGLREQYKEAATEEQPGVQWLIDRLSDYRQQRQQALEAYFEKLDEAALRRQVASCIQKGVAQHGKG
ncbi:MAG: CHAD domain-containing protein [Chloroflexi bacterium]|nr:MAG: CHAD domain-containing protein [Chloroflexota bacterium]